MDPRLKIAIVIVQILIDIFTRKGPKS